MAIIKEKRITISSVIDNLSPEGLLEGDSERTEISADGFFKIDADRFTIVYDESSEGGRIHHEIAVLSDEILLFRRGAIVCDLRFAEGAEERALYSIPPYSFDMTVKTKRIRKEIDRNGGRLDILYDMNIGGQDKRVRMKITL